MIHLLIATILSAPPQYSLPAAPSQFSVPQEKPDNRFWVQRADDPHYWSYLSDLEKLPGSQRISHDVLVCGPDGVYDRIYSRSTVQYVRTVLTEAMQKGVSRKTSPFGGSEENLHSTPRYHVGKRTADLKDKLPVGSIEALDELNEYRRSRGLPAYQYDEGLTIAAARAAKARADSFLFGYLSNDFACLPEGCRADAAGCAAYANTGWLSCCKDDNYRYAGAAYVIGRDGKRYMHVFCRR